MSLPIETPICFRCQKEALLCRCGVIDGQDLVTLTVQPTASSKEEGILRWVSLVKKHAHGRKSDAENFADRILEMGFVAAQAKVSCVVLLSPSDSTRWADSTAHRRRRRSLLWQGITQDGPSAPCLQRKTPTGASPPQRPQNKRCCTTENILLQKQLSSSCNAAGAS